ncbi:MAG TPA: hypothetical protein VIX42_00845 [Edaphobacter sp.]
MTNDLGASKALTAARAFLSGQIGAIEACWTLSSFAYNTECPLSQVDRNLFIAIQSETDDLPVGNLKDNWHPDYLPAKLEQLVKYETAVSNDVRGACQRLIAAVETKLTEAKS